MVAQRQEPKSQTMSRPDEGPEVIDVDADDQIELGAIAAMGEFSEVVVWDHEAAADSGADLYVRGMEERLRVAEKVRLNHPLCACLST